MAPSPSPLPRVPLGSSGVMVTEVCLGRATFSLTHTVSQECNTPLSHTHSPLRDRWGKA